MAAKDAAKAGEVRLASARLASATQPANDKDAEAAAARAAVEKSEAEAAIRDRLNRAGTLYARVVDRFHDTPPTGDLDKLYCKLSFFYRADCVYDLGDYTIAIKLYDTAAQRYQDDPACLAAYVQIVNAYCALGKLTDAKAANERAKWLLRKMPANSFSEAGPAMSKQYWEQWLKWTNDAGMFGAGAAVDTAPAAGQ
jgi:tetratricopeptide (TPR) repeat protein